MDTSWIKPYMFEQNEIPTLVDDTRVSDILTVTYIGFAKTGTDNIGEAKFKIKRVMVSTIFTDEQIQTITETKWAEGNLRYDKIWTNRANYNYQFQR